MFLSNPARLAARRFSPSSLVQSLARPLRASASKPSMGAVRSFAHARPAGATTSSKSLSLLLGTTLSTALVFRSMPSAIANDVASLPTVDLQHNVSVTHKSPVKSRFGGNLNYEELTIGSITGLFLGVIAGKLSSVFALLALSSYFLVQFLESRNIIHVPWTSIVQLGKEKIDLRQLVFEKPSFKFSFALAFLIAAFNI